MRRLTLMVFFGVAPVLVAHAEDILDPPHPAFAPIQKNLDHCQETNPGNIPESGSTRIDFRT